MSQATGIPLVSSIPSGGGVVSPGLDGQDGVDGLDSLIPGPIGPQGPTGPAGGSSGSGMSMLMPFVTETEDPFEPIVIPGPPGPAAGPFQAAVNVHVTHSVNQSIANSTNTVLAFNTERYDSDNLHDNATNNSRLTAPNAGKYLIIATISFATNSTGVREIFLRLNGITSLAEFRKAPAPTSPTVSDHIVTTIYELSAGDYVEVVVFQTSGGALDVVKENNFSPEFMMSQIDISAIANTNGEILVRKTVDASYTGETIVDVAQLNFTPFVNSDYLINFFIIYTTGNNTVPVRFYVNGPASFVALGGKLDVFDNYPLFGNTFVDYDSYSSGTSPSDSTDGLNYATIYCIFRNGVNADSFTLRIAVLNTTGFLLGMDNAALPDEISVTNDYLVLGAFTATTSGTMNLFRFHALGTGNVKVGIYSDSAGSPDVLLGSTGSVPVTTGANSIVFPNVSITSGTVYWLAINTDTIHLIRTRSTGGNIGYKALTFTDPFPDPAGGGFTTDVWILDISGHSQIENMATVKAGSILKYQKLI